jgi:hypothetical protein
MTQPLTCYIDGDKYDSPHTFGPPPLVGPVFHGAMFLTPEEFARVPLHDIRTILTMTHGRRVTKTLRFPPTFLSDRLPECRRVDMVSVAPDSDAVRARRAMPYIRSGLPVPATRLPGPRPPA